MKKRLSLVLAALMALSLVLTACSSSSSTESSTTTTESSSSSTTTTTTTTDSADEEVASESTGITGSYTIRLGTPTGGVHQQNVTMEEFKARIEEASGGAITVELYPTSQLGTVAQMIEGVQNADIEGVLVPTCWFASYAPALAVLDLPFMFDTEIASAQARDILVEGTSLNDYLYDRGFTVGGWLLGGNAYMLTTSPVESMSDLSGKTIWTIASPILQNTFAAFGASASALDSGDVAVALQNGTIDGTYNDCTFWLTQGLYENAKYMNMAPSTAFVNAFFFSSDWVDSLPADVAELVITTAEEVVEDYEVPYMIQYEQEAWQTMIDAGATVVEPSDELMAEMKEATAYLHDDFQATDAECAAIYEEIAALIAAY